GRDVLVAGTQVSLAGGSGIGGVGLAGAADSVTVDILGADGATVRSLALGASPAGARSFTWDGKAADGTTAPDGAYRMRVTATKGANQVAATTLTRAHVQAVDTTDTGAMLDLGAAGMKPLTDVKSYL
ncbi:MAG: hypothetical protein H7255_17155, partial [Ramlibacter sp.]|nr:hypothetical protein [Ramlibacter sp.]